ncbi:hypothetical protein JW935_24085 [candidate division KSB1 bacterium]|nr:hypothetical protein [candidate division KSB1 bacterium]
MKNILKIVSFSGLLLTVAPAFLVFYRVIDKPTHFLLMIIGTLLWFASAPLWMKGTSLE